MNLKLLGYSIFLYTDIGQEFMFCINKWTYFQLVETFAHTARRSHKSASVLHAY